jgi:hypothetical protein
MNIEALLDKNGQIYDIGIAILKETRYNLGIVSLYTHALEQLGKLKMVKDCVSSFDGQFYDLTSIQCDFYDHDKKIDIALQNINPACKDVFVNVGNVPIDLDLRLKLLHSDIDSSGNVVIAPTIDTDKIKNVISLFKTEQYGF